MPHVVRAPPLYRRLVIENGVVVYSLVDEEDVGVVERGLCLHEFGNRTRGPSNLGGCRPRSSSLENNGVLDPFLLLTDPSPNSGRRGGQ
jgi:hypothetical protein